MRIYKWFSLEIVINIQSSNNYTKLNNLRTIDHISGICFKMAQEELQIPTLVDSKKSDWWYLK